MARVGIIGWGSLLWDLDDLAERVSGEWLPNAGPHLPLEFSLVSRKRKRALAVVIDDRHGESCLTNVITSTRVSVHEAIVDLAERERCDPQQVGAVCFDSGHARSRSPAVRETVERWLGTSGYDAVVWTDTARNYEQMTGEAFSVPAALAYLRALEGESLREAKRYIDYAPAAVSTPLRRALQADAWWASLPL